MMYRGPNTHHGRGSAMAIAARPAWRTAMAVNTWAQIPSNLLTSIDPRQSLTHNPNYPGFPPWEQLAVGGTNSHSNDGVITPWCSGDWDDATGTYHHGLGGGHQDYGGNEPYRINLNADAPAWEMVRPPSGSTTLIASGLPAGSTPQGSSFLLDDGLETTGVYADGRPRAIHSYCKHTWVPGLGLVLVVQGGVFINTGESTKVTWLLNAATGEWEYRGNGNGQNLGGSSSGASVYDSSRNVIYWLGAGTSILHKLDLSTWLFSPIGTSFSSSGDTSLIYIPGHDVLIQACVFYANKFVVIDPTTGTRYQPSVTGTAPAWVGGSGRAWLPGVGLVVEVGGVLSALTPTGNAKTDPWAWSTLTQSGTPVANGAQGMYKKFGYSATLGGFYRFTTATEKPWFFATE